MIFGPSCLQSPGVGVAAAMLWVETGLTANDSSPSVLWEHM